MTDLLIERTFIRRDGLFRSPALGFESLELGDEILWAVLWTAAMPNKDHTSDWLTHGCYFPRAVWIDSCLRHVIR